MIYNFPYYSRAYYRRPQGSNYYPYNSYYNSRYYNNINSNFPKNTSKREKNYTNEEKKQIEERASSDNSEKELFEIFAIKLFFDDILLICLIFFLYNEGVKDQYLFISLILLLLT